ncbi:alpha/beta fold hydrolase [Gottfriedia acidiceleris]|uniref:prolyl aminopeptidase n=1 Tax=Gottfriedia acidiceleris TaxID=371036 RepID=A0ABY4JIN7_9BACI|nr:alpha/beta hydrolase [Gottfriedia acidiceleris]UPM52622.1 alpha/beta hydrolase [Gottfriedia acidiceleris]
MTKSNILPDIFFRQFNQRKNEKKLEIYTEYMINEEKYVTIGGIDQWITIRGEDRRNPILLLIHGGPASTYTIFSPIIRPWERHFTIVQWDQRGAGKTFKRNGKEGCGKITFNQLAEDGIELSNLICNELEKEKIILVGSSVGSLIATLMIKERPNLFYAYVGTDQNCFDYENIAYQLAIDALSEQGNKRRLKKFKELGPDQTKWTQKDYDKRNQIVVKSIKNVPNMVMDLILPSMLSSPQHTINDLLDIFKGMKFSGEQLFNELMNFNYGRLGTVFSIPFFIFQGDNDIITPTKNAERFLQKIEAPLKEFIYINNAGHLACFARPEQFLQELINRVRPLAINN